LVPADRRVVLILAVVFAITTCFLVTAGQLGNVYSLWLQDRVDRGVGSVTIPVTWFQSLTPLFSLALTPILLALWQKQAVRGTEPSLFAKMAIGLGMGGSGLLLLALLSMAGRIGWWWLLPTHALVCLAYIFVYPVALALFSRVAPEGGRAMYIGLFFLSSFVASNLVGALGRFYAVMDPSAFWALHGALGLGGALAALLAIRPFRAILDPRDQGVRAHA
jgi:POT family proton-dependent oligopeptide transporter